VKTKKSENMVATYAFDFEKYTDKYFLRAYEILKQDKLNPFVRAQIFVRKGPGVIAGMKETVSFILNYSRLEKNGGRVYALFNEEEYEPLETILVIEAQILDIIRFETLYLGMLSAALAVKNDQQVLNLENAAKRMKAVTDAAEDRPVIYFGARHWSYREDAAISKAAIKGGAVGAATDIGAAHLGQKGSGTIPHALENIYAWKDGKENAVVNATRAFDRHISQDVNRVALIDYNNTEIDDAIKTAQAVPALKAIRIDTCGENVSQGALSLKDIEGKTEAEIQNIVQSFFKTDKDIPIPKEEESFWFGTGVSITGVYAIRKALNDNGFGHIQIMLSSGFGNADKVKAFTRAEKILDIRLFDSLGVGGIYDSRDATMDIVAVGDTIDTMVPVSKVGRSYRPNPRLKRVA
jgi:nicotinate phosphoribosyltransferase